MKSLPSTKFSSYSVADATAGTTPDGAVRAGTGAVFAGAAALAGAVQSDGMAGVARATVRAFARAGQTGRAHIGRESDRRLASCRGGLERTGREVIGQAAVAMPEPVGQAQVPALVAVGRAAAVPEGVDPVVAAAAVAAVEPAAAVVVADRAALAAAPAAISDPTPVARGVTD